MKCRKPVAYTQLQNLIKITKASKESNYDILRRRLCLQHPAPAYGRDEHGF